MNAQTVPNRVNVERIQSVTFETIGVNVCVADTAKLVYPFAAAPPAKLHGNHAIRV